MNDAIRGAVYGHLVGDAIGVPYEFSAPDPGRVVALRGHGTHGQPPGTWSDDGALMLALLDSLLNAGFDPEDQGRRAVAWTDAKAYTPDGSDWFVCRYLPDGHPHCLHYLAARERPLPMLIAPPPHGI